MNKSDLIRVCPFAYHRSRAEETAIESAGQKHNETVEMTREEMYNLVDKMVQSNVNVGVYKNKKNDLLYILFVSDDMWRQR